MVSYKIPILFLSFIALSIFILPSNAQNAAQDYVDTHNSARALVSVGGVTWDTTLAAYAQTYAYARRSDCNIIPSGGTYGENIAKGQYDLVFTGIEAVNQWVLEKPNYNHTTNACQPGKQCRHYTQVVWSASVRIGCARVACVNSPTWYYVVCSYDPPGNTLNGWPY